MISKSLSTSERRAALHSEAGKLAEFCQALYPLLVAHADDWGCLQGDVFTVKHMVDPTSPRKLADFKSALIALHNVGLIAWYLDGERWVVYIRSFSAHQSLKGHDKDGRKREFSPPPEKPSKFTEVAQARPDSPKPALREEKRTEENRTSHTHARTPVDVELVQQMTDRYAELHLEIVGVGYIGNMGADYQEWIRLLSVFDPEMLKKLMVYWFHTKDKFTEDGTRTVAKFRSRASKYAEELKAKKLA